MEEELAIGAEEESQRIRSCIMRGPVDTFPTIQRDSFWWWKSQSFLVKEKAAVAEGPDEGTDGKDIMVALASAEGQSSKLPLIEYKDTQFHFN